MTATRIKDDFKNRFIFMKMNLLKINSRRSEERNKWVFFRETKFCLSRVINISLFSVGVSLFTFLLSLPCF